MSLSAALSSAIAKIPEKQPEEEIKIKDLFEVEFEIRESQTLHKRFYIRAQFTFAAENGWAVDFYSAPFDSKDEAKEFLAKMRE